MQRCNNAGNQEVIPAVILVSRQIRNFLAEKFRPYGIGVEQAGVLFVLQEYGSLSVTEISDMLFKDKGTVSRTIESLYQKKLVQKNQKKGDNRIVKIAITHEGYEKIETIQTTKSTSLDIFRDCVTKSEKEEFLRILDKIAAVMR